MTKYQFTLWAQSRGFIHGRYGHLIRQHHNPNGQLVYTERFRFVWNDSVVFELLMGRKHAVKNGATGAGILHTIHWSWKFIRRVKLKWVEANLQNDCDGIDQLPKGSQTSFFPI